MNKLSLSLPWGGMTEQKLVEQNELLSTVSFSGAEIKHRIILYNHQSMCQHLHRAQEQLKTEFPSQAVATDIKA